MLDFNLSSWDFWIFSCIYSGKNAKCITTHCIIIFIFLSYWPKEIAEFVLVCIFKCFELHCIDVRLQFKQLGFLDFLMYLLREKCEMHHYALHHYFHFSQLLAERDCGICIGLHFQ